MGEVEGRKNVLWLMPVDGTGSQMLLSCECADKFVKVKQQVQEYCRGTFSVCCLLRSIVDVQLGFVSVRFKFIMGITRKAVLVENLSHIQKQTGREDLTQP